MKAQNSRAQARNGGFTLLEVMVTLVIAAILAGIAVPTIIPMWQQQRTVERQANAELIYTTAQSNMAKLKAKGLLSSSIDDANAGQAVKAGASTYTTLAESITAARNAEQSETDTFAAEKAATDADAGLIVLSSDDDSAKSALELLVPDIANQVSDVGFGGLFHASDPHYCIEINPTTGYVYGAFYSENQDNCNYREYENDSAKSASAVRGDDRALAQMNVAYYGGGKPTTFGPTDAQQIGYIGYFEFAGGSSNATVTGGYSYRINKDYSISDNAVNTLSSDNEINENAVESSDGTAYGVLVEKKLVDEKKFTPPSDVYPDPYTVTVDSSVVGETNAGEYYFYKLDAPTSAEGHKANYTIKCDFCYINSYDHREYVQWSWTYTEQAPVGSLVHLTNDDISKVNNGQVWGQINGQDKYRIDVPQSTLSGRVKEDGSLVLTVHLVKDNPNVTATQLPDVADGTSTVLTNGVGIWYPWAGVTSGPDDLKRKAFYVNQNFAGAIIYLHNDEEESAPNKLLESSGPYQVRTDDQLQHIGSPYGSTQSTPNAQYLSKTFRQTHNIEINGTRDGAQNVLWHPIGQAQATSLPADQKPQFTGTFDGGGNTIYLQNGYALSSYNDTSGGSTNPNEAYATTNGYHSFGIFGYVTGSIKNTTVNIDVDGETSPLKHTLANPHYGTLVGDLVEEGSIDNANVVIKPGSALTVSNSTQYCHQNLALGGLCGLIDDKATIRNSSFKLESADGAAPASVQNARFQLIANSSNDEANTLDVGGFVGRANCSSTKFLENCSVILEDSASIDGNWAKGKEANVGGFIASSHGSGSISNCYISTDAQLKVGSTLHAGSNSAEASIGGFIGRLAPSSAVREYAKDGETPLKMSLVDSRITGQGNLDVETNGFYDRSYLGGFAGLIEQEAIVQKASISLGDDINIDSQNSQHASTGGFVGTARGNSSIEYPLVKTDKSVSNTISSTQGDARAGGLIGSLEGTAALKDDATLSEATYSGTPSLDAGSDLAVSATSSGNVAHTGGIIGDTESQTNISKPSLNVAGTAKLTANGQQASSVGGAIGSYRSRYELDTPSVCVGKDLSVSGKSTSSNSSYAAGIVGYVSGPDASSDETTSIAHSTMTVGGSATFEAIAQGDSSYAGGAIGHAHQAKVSDTNIAIHGNSAVTANCPYHEAYSAALLGKLDSSTIKQASVRVDGKLESKAESSTQVTYAGGLIGEATGTSEKADSSKCTRVEDISLAARKDVSVEASSNSETNAGGIAGYATRTIFNRASFEESKETSAADKATITISATKASTWDNKSYAGGAFGQLVNASVANSYIATRNATLKLNNTNGSDNGTNNMSYTGGFAGSAAGKATTGEDDDALGSHSIASSFISADIVGASEALSGFVDNTDDVDGRHSAFVDDFVLGSISGFTAANKTYAFTRNLERGESLKGSYAAVTDSNGDTPYDFADGSTLSDTGRCFVYRKDMNSLTDEKAKRNDGAHPASYAYLTRALGEGAKEQVSWDSDFKSNSVLDYIGKDGEKSKYDFVAGSKANGDEGSIYGLSGTNPFPTATKDKDGKYVNYGKWIAAPKGAN